MFNSKILKISIAFVSLVVCITQVQQTYAKYVESKEGTSDFEVAAWSILLNDEDITTGAELSTLINPVYDSNSHVASGVIAPGSSGHFELEIDATNTEVSFQYNISITSSNESDVTDLAVTGYSIDNGSVIPVTGGVNNLTNTINYNAQNKVVNLTIYFEWVEGNGETMNNAADTAASVGGGTGKLAVRANFTQVVN